MNKKSAQKQKESKQRLLASRCSIQTTGQKKNQHLKTTHGRIGARSSQNPRLFFISASFNLVVIALKAMGIRSVVRHGFEGLQVLIECRMSHGLPSMTIIGGASRSVDEARERIRSAFITIGIPFPKKRIVINLAPADTPKQDTGLDLAIAVAMLQAEGHIPPVAAATVFFGELGLDGSLRPVRGLLGSLLACRKYGLTTAIVPIKNHQQASLIANMTIIACRDLREVMDILQAKTTKPTIIPTSLKPPRSPVDIEPFNNIVGQEHAKRALIIAAAGRHNILLKGPPGTGKTMLAQAFRDLLPPMSQQEIIETTHLHSLRAHRYHTLVRRRPLRSPHHTASDAAITGGGRQMHPGEISLAHNGILFLDEFPEFRRNTIEALRQPLEDKSILLSRVQTSVRYPADFVLIATANPCPCGYYGTARECHCTPASRLAYQQKLSGPVLDRIDIHVTVIPPDTSQLLQTKPRTKTTIRQQIDQAEEMQRNRFGDSRHNNSMSNQAIKRWAKPTPSARLLLSKGADSLGLSARAYMRTLKVARTIADLEEQPNIKDQHIAEALQYRISI